MQQTGHGIGQVLIYAALIFWAFVSLFPVYWTITTSMKVAKDVQLGHMIPWVDFMPTWLGWRSLGLSPDTIYSTSTVRDEFLSRFLNSIITAVGASVLAVLIGGLAAYGLSPLPVQVPLDAQQGHLVLLPVAAHPAAGGVGAALPGPLQVAGAARHHHRPGAALHADSAADRHLDHEGPVRHHPDRARRSRAGRRPVVLGHVPADHPADRAARAWSPPSSCR